MNKGYISHKNMKDIAFEVFGYKQFQDYTEFVGLWYQASQGLYDNKDIEFVKVYNNEVEDWSYFDNIRTLKARQQASSNS